MIGGYFLHVRSPIGLRIECREESQRRFNNTLPKTIFVLGYGVVKSIIHNCIKYDSKGIYQKLHKGQKMYKIQGRNMYDRRFIRLRREWPNHDRIQVDTVLTRDVNWIAMKQVDVACLVYKQHCIFQWFAHQNRSTRYND